MSKTTSDYSKRQAEYQRIRREKRKAKGLCPQCGKRKSHGVSPSGRAYVTCAKCRSRQKVSNDNHKERENYEDPTRGKPDPITTTGAHYEVKRTGEVGKVMPCPCDDPLILGFAGGNRDAYHIRELRQTHRPVTGHGAIYTANGLKGRPKGIEDFTIAKMLAIVGYLQRQSEPVRRSQLDKAMGFNCHRVLMQMPSNKPGVVSLESLGVVRRVPLIRNWVAWELTDIGRAQGETIIESLQKRKGNRL